MYNINGKRPKVTIRYAFTPSRRKEIMTQAYCVKCKAKQDMKDAQAVTMKNGKPAMTGTCPKCGTKMYKIGAAK